MTLPTRLIVLTGLVTVEKIDLGLALAHHFATREPVALVDHMGSINIAQDRINASRIKLIRLNESISQGLTAILYNARYRVILFITAPTIAPDILLTTLSHLQDTMPSLAIYTLALVDNRTCDCFPAVRQLYEETADAVVHLPEDGSTVINLVNTWNGSLSSH